MTLPIAVAAPKEIAIRALYRLSIVMLNEGQNQEEKKGRHCDFEDFQQLIVHLVRHRRPVESHQ